MEVKNKIQLITYPDSLGGDLSQLKNILNQHFKDIFQGGIHLLPPFPSSSDRGYSPISYLEIDPKFGTWEDIQDLGQDYDLLIDLIINHLSAQSSYFKDFLKNGQDSEYADMFLSLHKLWEDGIPVPEDIENVFLRRKYPYSEYKIEKTGNIEKVWTTFGKENPSEQIDVDIHSKTFRRLIEKTFSFFSEQHIKTVRLDAIGYVIKKLETACFFVEPEINEFIDWIINLANKYNIALLPEVHSHHSIQRKLSAKGLYIYDFILPYLVLEALENKNSKKLIQYINDRPEKQFTMLDCHDGIPVKPDLDDLVNAHDAQKTVDTCMERGANLSLVLSESHQGENGFNVHQIRGTYYSLLGEDDDAYIIARAIQFFVPGVPQVYYVGLLAGKNDEARAAEIGDGREINRHNYSEAEIKEEMERPVVQRLLKLMRFRNAHPAFDGKFSVLESDQTKLSLSWKLGNEYCELRIDLSTMDAIIHFTDDKQQTQFLHL